MMFHFMTHSNWVPGYPDTWPKITSGSGWHYTGSGELREADFSPTLGKTHPVCWKSRSNASLVRNNYLFDLTSSREHISFLTLNQDSPEPSGSALLGLWVSCILMSTSFRQSASSRFPPLSLSHSPLRPAPSTHTPAMFLHRILRHIIR